MNEEQDDHFVTVVMRMDPAEADALREVSDRVHGPVTVSVVADPTEYGGRLTRLLAEVHTIGSLPDIE